MGLLKKRRSYGITPYGHGKDVAITLEASLDSDRLNKVIKQVEI